MDVGPFARIATLIWDARFSLVTALLAGFGRAAAEVGAVIIVGGNIDGFTRTMTTAIALETSKGDLAARDRARPGADHHRDLRQRRGLGHAARRRTAGGMTMRAIVTDLPVVFEDVSFAIARRERFSTASRSRSTYGPPTVLIGPNGAGKTTLLRLAMGLDRGRAPAASPGAAARTCRPPTAPSSFSARSMLRRSAAANIRYALNAAGVERAAQSARAAELLALVGLGELGERPARKLSGGEQQRLALARALAKEPQILFLDEPTASLDPAATKAIEDVVRAVAARGIKVVMSTHDLGEARRIAGEIVLMHRGRVVETAPAETFFSAPKTEEARRFVAGELLV